jgi:iron complex outermembrane receptor protein
MERHEAALDYTPGVFAQPKWGEDTRLSIRGSGLSRNFHLRGVQLYMDGIPINTADGYGDFQEIDPTAYRHVDLYKGGNGLRFGANSLGGAINFVTPTGRSASPFEGRIDAGSFDFYRLQASTGGVNGRWDGFLTGSWQQSEGYREHSWGHSARASMNFGYRISSDIETRFYFNANEIRQRIPGEVDKETALHSPKTAAAKNVTFDWQRNIDSFRVANVTTVRFDTGKIDFGVFGVNRHLMHPIFQWLDYHYLEYGAFTRLLDERKIGGFDNRFVAGLNLHNGDTDAKNYDNLAGAVKGALLTYDKQHSSNLTSYAENSFYFLPRVAFVAGTQYVSAGRKQNPIFGADQAFDKNYDLWSPKIGLLWDVARDAQIFANISKSAEVPSFGQGILVDFNTLKPQRATTYEVGTRGRKPDLTWDLSAYRSNITDEIQCLTVVFGTCSERNAPHTIHQGIEAGLGVAVLKSLFTASSRPDKLWLNAAYTYSDFYFDNDPIYGNNELPVVPRHYVRGELLYKHPDGWFIGPNVEWVPVSYFVDNANTFKSSPYVLWGLRAGYDPGGTFSFYLEARNLADRAYISSANAVSVYDPVNGANLFNPGNGRAIFAGMRMKM